MSASVIFLPPTSEGWGKVLFSACVSVHTWEGGVPLSVNGGTPSGPDGGYPHPSQWGVPPGLDEGTLLLELDGVPPQLEFDVGIPPHQDWMVYPTPIRRQSSRASTCYMAGSMPLAFAQEDFLVSLMS